MIAVTGGQPQDSGGRRAIGGWRLDSGVQLLASGPLRQRFRWSTDPDAPAARALCDGEIRLSVRRIEVRVSDVVQAGTGAIASGSAEGNAWRVVMGTGVGVVEETRSTACSVGVILRGRLPIGTHCVLRVVAADAHGMLASLARDAPAASMRYAWCAGPLQSPTVTGMDAVEQAVVALRDLGHTSLAIVPLSLVAADSSRLSTAPITDASCLCK